MKRPRAACTGALALQFRGEGVLLVVIVVLILAGAGAAAAALAAAQVRQIELQLLAAVGAQHAALLQDALVEEDLLLTAGTGRLVDLAVLIAVVILPVQLVEPGLHVRQVVADGVQPLLQLALLVADVLQFQCDVVQKIHHHMEELDLLGVGVQAQALG